MDRQRLSLRVRGVVQAVGFRPFVYRLAQDLALGGTVCNRDGSVEITVEGLPLTLEAFQKRLRTEAPPASRIVSVEASFGPAQGVSGFTIAPSVPHKDAEAYVSPDLATCQACVTELFTASDRRVAYPFNTCVNCGPRLTVIRSLPYDRIRTTLQPFVLCPSCQEEYDTPADRRFHAESIGCDACGPRLALLGRPPEADALETVATVIERGGIAALKGLGGFQIACDATNAEAVTQLRARKRRPHKPFAVMVPNLAMAHAVAHLKTGDESLLGSAEAPIVLVPRCVPSVLADEIAPHMSTVGLMLPYTPLHHLLLRRLDRPLVMTSGNISGEPLCINDDEARRVLVPVVDEVLTHNRDIAVACDDGVVRSTDQGWIPIRNARGRAPRVVAMPTFPSPGLAVGGHMKSAFALGTGEMAVVGPHIGDQGALATALRFAQCVEHFERLYRLEPQWIAHDLHPDYGSTLYAEERHRNGGQPLIAVQHHHAHFAACLAENGHSGPALGVIFDGTGWGEDGTIWGGEFLIGTALKVQRVAHLRTVPLVGGDQAIREPWRVALAYLRDAEVEDMPRFEGVPEQAQRHVERMLRQQSGWPRCSSAGRLFDAVASILGVRATCTYEGQAAAELESLADSTRTTASLSIDLEETPQGWILDARALVRDLYRARSARAEPSILARGFHAALSQAVVAVCTRVASAHDVEHVALTGGVFVNALLLQGVVAGLLDVGLKPLFHHHVPPNDGGLCLGQLAVARARLSGK